MPIRGGARVSATVSTGVEVSVAIPSPAAVGSSVGTQTYRASDPYTGPYEVTPTDYEQGLPTSGKHMNRNVTVHKVPYAETSNESGGTTVSILS